MTERAVQEMKRSIPGFKGIPDSDTSPPELAAELVLQIAQGKVDSLSGRYIHARDDLVALLGDADRIIQEDRLALRLREWNS